ncbi:MAG: ATP-binding cassette domain-containing protein [Burkholderiaceae bacterium]|jgi:phospholipid/cholesterol/gamma-HCH transport system ATP-binding protein|nr:ATP-binding cassette domain-containing protein [Burkholderiaceae bacterium]
MNTSDAPEIIRIEELWTQLGNQLIHQDLDLTVRQGDIVSLVGGSGSGKTTLLRVMLGLQKPLKGKVSVLGIDIAASNNQSPLYHHCGVLFQQGALFSALNVMDNVALPLRELRALPENLIEESVLLKLQMVGLTPADALKMPADLSGGMVKRVALARALSLEPDLLFLDEPTAGLDPLLSDSFVELIRSLHDELSLTVVMVSHDLDSILQLSSHIAVLANRHVIVNGTPQEVIAVDHPFIHDFFLGDRGKRALTGTPDLADIGKLENANGK